MSRSLKNILLLFVVLFLLDYAAGLFLSQTFIKIKFGSFGKINTSLNTNTDLVILGSSRAMYHYDPDVFNSTTSNSCYNSGLGGYGILYNYTMLNELIKVHIPKIVILDLSPNVLNDKESYEKLNLFMPYVGEYQSFKDLMRLNPNYHFISTVSRVYKYNSTLYEQFRNLTSKSEPNNGFLGLPGIIDTSTFSAFYYDDSPLDTNKLFYFKEIIKLCRNNDIRLINIISPTYVKYDTSNTIISNYKDLANKSGVEFLDYSSLEPFYQNPSYFKDQLHLNKPGAEEYSLMISSYINQDRIKKD